MDSNEKIIQLEAEIEKLRKQVLTDELTGLPNYRSFNSALQREWERACRDKTPLSAIFIDIDYFKAANDFYGQLKANDILRDIGNLIGNCTRNTDVATRPMGDEFIILLPNTDMDGATQLARKIEDAIISTKIPNRGSPEKITTITYGEASVMPSKDTTKEDLINTSSRCMSERKKAKKAHLKGKNSGKNQAVLAT